MKKGPIVAITSLTLVASLALAPAAAFADRFRGGSVGGRAIVRRPVVNRSVVVHPFFPRPFFRPVIPFGVIVAPVVIYTPSPLYYAPPTYYDSSGYSYPPAVYGGPPASGTVAVAPAPTPSPMPSVVHYPNGRYELRGDGITTPYTWVWIPNPPPPPPPSAAPPEGAPPAPPKSGDPAPGRQSQLYRWTDEQGVAHWTDSRAAVPQQYRAQAKGT
jgi:hypothetical protein